MQILDLKQLQYYDGKIKNYISNSYASLQSPSFTGTPTSVTPSAGDNSTKIATTKYVQTELGTAKVASAGEFTSAKSVTLTGDVTGSASSKGGWSISTTLSNTGVDANTYGPLVDASPAHSGSFTVPKFTVDAKGRITTAGNITVTLPSINSLDTKVTQTVTASNDEGKYPILAKNVTATATVTDTSKFAAGITIQPSTGAIEATKFIGSFEGNASSADSVPWSGVDGKPSAFTPSAHNQASNTINAMTGYSKPSSTSAIGTSDTLNAAIGKLEKAIDGKAAAATTLAGYNISDAKIASGVITLGSNTITPLTSSSSLNAAKLTGTAAVNTTGKATTAGTADKVANSLALKLKSGTTEGTDLYTFDGSGAKTLDIKQGSNVTLTAAEGSLTITAKDTVYTHPTTSGNKHIPSGGSSGQFLGWDSDGTAKWVANPNSDTKNTAGSTDSSSKLFLVGATSQAANPQTYSHDTAYVGTDGCLYSGGAKVLTAHQTLPTLSYTESGSGNAITGISVSNHAITATKGSTFLTSHQSLANYVTLNGAQTISAVKTFTAKPVLNQVGLDMTVKDTTEGSTTTRTSQVLHANSSNSQYGINIAFCSGGNAVVGGGEAGTAQLNALAGNSGEDLYLVADGNIYLKPNGNTWANAKTITLNTSGELSGLSKVTSTSFVGALTGNASSATEFSAAKSVTLTGDVTGTASSKAGWSVATTLANSGVTAGSYGPSDNATPGYGATFNVPYITVDAKGRVTACSTKTVKIPASDNTNTDTLMTQNVSTTNNTYPILAVATANATANLGAKTGIFGSGIKINPSTSEITATRLLGAVKADKGTGSYVNSLKVDGALITGTHSAFGAIWNAPTKTYRVGCATYPTNDEKILWYSITQTNVNAGTNTVAKSMSWDGSTGALATASFAGDVTNCTLGTASRAVVTDGSKKLTVSSVTSTELGYVSGVTSAIQTQLNAKAPLASPALTGTPTAPTAAAGTNTTQIATTAFVNTKCGNYLPLAGGTMTGQLTMGSSQAIHFKNANITRGTAPSASQYPFYLLLKDSADKTLAGVYYEYLTDKSAKSHLMCYQGTTNANTWHSIGAGYDASGNPYTWARTPGFGNNSTQIATTEFVYKNAAKHFAAATNIYVAKAATGNGSGSNTSNYMSLADLRNYLATVHMHSSTADMNGSYTLTILFKAGDSFGNASFDAAKMPGIRNLLLNTSTGTASTTSNYSTNSPTFGNISVSGDIAVTIRNINCTGRISAQYGAYVAVDTYVGLSSLHASNWAYVNVAKNMIIDVCDAHTDYLFAATNSGILAMWPGATVTINFRNQCYYTRCLFMSSTNGSIFVGYSSFKLTGTKPMMIWAGSGTLTGTSETAAGTAAKVVPLASGQTFTLATNATAKIRFTVDNTAANPTLNINSTGAKPIWWNGAAVAANMLAKNMTYDVKYDGTHYVIQNALKRLTNNDVGVFRSTGNYNQTYNSGSWNFDGYTVSYGTGIENGNWRGNHIGNIEQRVTTGNNTYPILFSGTANATANTSTIPYFGSGVKINPSTSTVYATTFSGAFSGNVTGNCSGSSGSCTGNAKTATTLQTARYIDGVSFNGSADIAHYASCSTAAGTAAKTAAITGFALKTGAKATIKFTVANTAASPTMNINSTGAKSIATIPANGIEKNKTYELVYNGSSYDVVGSNESVPVGSIIWSARTSAPAGYLICDGSAVSRTTYADLFAAIGTKYGTGNGSSTFNLPNLIDKFPQGSQTANVGTAIAAGLPNISGGHLALLDLGGLETASGGPWTVSSAHVTAGYGGGDSYDCNIDFDASKANAIYGKSNTVQPPALKLLPCIKAYGEIMNTGSLDASKLATDMATLSSDLRNMHHYSTSAPSNSSGADGDIWFQYV